MSSIVKSLLTQGEHPTDSLTRVRAIRLYNGSLWFVTLMAAAYIPLFYLLDQLLLSVVLSGFVGLYFLAISMQVNGWFTLSRLVFLLTFNCGLSVYHSLTGEQFSFIILYLVFVTSANLFILRHEWPLKIVFVAIPTALLIFHESSDYQYIQPLSMSIQTSHWLRGLLVPTFVAFFIAMEYYIAATFLKRERSLEKARDQVISADQTKSEFISLMSHELRTPINAISSTLAELELKQSSFSMEELQTLQTSTRQLEHLVGNFVDFKTMMGGKSKLAKQSSINLMQLLTELCEEKRRLAQERGSTIELGFVDALPEQLTLASGALSLAFGHVLENAIRFSEHSKVEVRCFCQAQKEQFWGICIEVIDHGIGISEAQKAQIFEPFYQGESVRQRQIGGMGLGLAISQQSMQLCGGQITFISEKGDGSTFCLRFNAQRSSNAAKPAVRAIDQLLQGKRVLVVDDNPVNQKISRKFIEKLGAEVETLSDGSIAVKQCLSERFDVIFMDLHMPTMDGFTATKSIRKDGLNRQTPIIAYSADSQDIVQQQALVAGMNSFVQKPLHLETLRRIIIELIDAGTLKTTSH